MLCFYTTEHEFILIVVCINYNYYFYYPHTFVSLNVFLANFKRKVHMLLVNFRQLARVICVPKIEIGGFFMKNS